MEFKHLLQFLSVGHDIHSIFVSPVFGVNTAVVLLSSYVPAGQKVLHSYLLNKTVPIGQKASQDLDTTFIYSTGVEQGVTHKLVIKLANLPGSQAIPSLHLWSYKNELSLVQS